MRFGPDGCASGIVEFTIEEALPVPASPALSVNDPDCENSGTVQVTNFDPELEYIFYLDEVVPMGSAALESVSIDANGLISGEAGNYIVIATNGICDSEASEFSIEEQLPSPEAAELDISEADCGINSQVRITNYSPNLYYEFEPSASIDEEGYILGEPGDYELWVRFGPDGCASGIVEFTILPMIPAPSFVVKAIEPEFCYGLGSFEFTFTNIADGTYDMHYDGGSFKDVIILNAMATVEDVAVGEYKNLTIVNEYGCSSAADITIYLNNSEAPALPQLIENDDATCLSNSTVSFVNYSSYSSLAVFTFHGDNSHLIELSEDGVISGPAGTFNIVVWETACPTPPISFVINEKLPTADAPIIATTSGTCEADGTAKIQNYESEFTYEFTPAVIALDAQGNIDATAGSYSVIAINTAGCESEATSFVIEEKLISPVAIVLDVVSATCEAATTAVITNYDAALTYVFFPEGPSITTEGDILANAGTYSVYATNGDCQTKVVEFVIEAQYPTPTLIVTAVDPINCDENGYLNFEFTNVLDGSYTISFDQAEFTNVLVQNGLASVEAAPGQYNNLMISNSYGCSSAEGVNAVIHTPEHPEAPQAVTEVYCYNGEEHTVTAVVPEGQTVKYFSLDVTGGPGEPIEALVATESGIYNAWAVAVNEQQCESEPVLITMIIHHSPVVAIETIENTPLHETVTITATHSSISDPGFEYPAYYSLHIQGASGNYVYTTPEPTDLFIHSLNTDLLGLGEAVVGISATYVFDHTEFTVSCVSEVAQTTFYVGDSSAIAYNVSASANPSNAGHIFGLLPSYFEGQQVTATAVANNGFVFSHWTATGIELDNSTLAAIEFEMPGNNVQLVAHFIASGNSLSGTIRYFNQSISLIPEEANIMIALYKGEELIVGPMDTSTGSYDFGDVIVPGENYTIRLWEDDIVGESWSWNNWGGVNATDALITSYIAAQNPSITQFNWIAPHSATQITEFAFNVANVNNDRSVNSIDALLIGRRAIEMIDGFPNGKPNFLIAGGDDYPNAPTTMFDYHGDYQAETAAGDFYYSAPYKGKAGSQTFNIYYIASGDVNASYVPRVMKNQMALNYNNVVEVEAGQEIAIPLRLDQAENLGAMTIGLKYDNSILEVLSVESNVFEANMIHMNPENAEIKLAWFDINGRDYSAQEEIITVHARLLAPANYLTDYFMLDGNTEFADRDAKVVDVKLNTVALISGTANELMADIEAAVHPNPFNSETTISYLLPESGKVQLIVYNSLGQEVVKLVEEAQEAGRYSVQLHGDKLINSGTYFYRLQFEGATRTQSLNGTMIHLQK